MADPPFLWMTIRHGRGNDDSAVLMLCQWWWVAVGVRGRGGVDGCDDWYP